MSDIQVVIYGASGYTGEHVMWKLAERGIPFIAAGRNRARLEKRIAAQAELRKARYEIVEVEHDEAALTELLRGKKVVINLVGPFVQYGEPVLKAALSAGCHYADTTGEQDWKIVIRERYGKAFADKGLVLSPACGAMWIGGLLAAESVLEKPGIDSVDIVYAVAGVPSAASTLSFMRMCCQPQMRLVERKLEAWPPSTNFKVAVPTIHEVMTALPWSGGGESIFFQDDPRVMNCQTLVTFRNEALMAILVPKMQEFEAKYAHLSVAEQERVTNSWGMEIAPQGDVPREDVNRHRTLYSCHGRGKLVARSTLTWGATGYVFAGVVSAVLIESILLGHHKAVGFQPATKAIGVTRLRAELLDEGVLGQTTAIVS